MLKFTYLALMLTLGSYLVKSHISDEECGIIEEESTTIRINAIDNGTASSIPIQAIKPKKDYKGRARPDQRSLLIVFDGTGSMSADLAQLRGGAQEIVNKLALREDNPIFNYVLSVFRDPDISLPLITKEPTELLSALNAIVVDGGGDCPELALKGLKNALENALPNSLAYVFSDASAKDYGIYDDVIHIIQKKQIKVSFLLTGVCGDGKSANGYTVYEKISRASEGQVFDMQRDNVKDVLLTISDAMESKFEPLKSLDFDTPGSSTTTVNIDQSFTQLSVSMSGLNSKLSVKDHNDTEIKCIKSFSSANIKFMTFDVADTSYKIEASADSAYSLRIGGISDLKFEFGFSTNVPSMQTETAIQPLVAVPNVLSIFISDPKLVKCLIRATIIPASTKESFTPIDIPLKRMKANFFTTNLFDIPKQMFKIQIFGYVSKGNPIERLISTGIESIAGIPPEVEIDYDTLTVNEKSKLHLNCIVKSLTPVKMSWFFEAKFLHSKSSNQSASFLMMIENFSPENVGKYICKAENDIGSDAKDVAVNIKLAPTVTVDPSTINIESGTTGSLKCIVNNADGEFKIVWINEHGLRVENSNDIFLFNATRHHHYKNLTCEVEIDDFLISNSSLVTVEYAPDFKKGTNGGTIPRRIIHGDKSTLSCETHENPEATAKWFFYKLNSKTKTSLDSRSKSLTLQNMNSFKRGIYECLIQNSIGNATKYFKVEHVPKESPKIQSDKRVFVKENQNVELKCFCLDCLPIKKHTWAIKSIKRRRHEVKALADEEMDKFTTVMKIEKATKTDGGVYECLISNKLGKEKYQIALIVRK